MQKFKFRLESALRLRQLRVDAEMARLRELMLQRKRLQAAFDVLQEERAQSTRFVYGMADPGAHDLRALAVFNIGAEARSRQMTEALARADNALKVAQQRVYAAERDKRALEKLRSKQLQGWAFACEREIETGAQELWLLSHTKSKDDGESGEPDTHC